MKWYATPAELLALAKFQPGINVYPLYAGPFALIPDLDKDIRSGVVLLATVRVFRVTVGPAEYVATVVCRMADSLPEWTIYCGDPQVGGLVRQYGAILASSLRKEGVVEDSICKKVEQPGWVGLVPDMQACNFFKMQTRSGRICSHTQAALASIDANVLTAMAVELQGWLAGDAEESAEDGPVSAEEEAFYDAAFVQHVFLAGERGSGKTFLARKAADRFGAVYLEMQMHPSMEAWEFRAHDRVWNGKVYTVLGKLAEAVYWIQQGKKVVLCMDEFLNMNPLYATAINTPLTLTGNDTYMIETGRILDVGDGTGRLETVEVPSSMLWIVATSNIGARYEVPKMAPSVRARFQVVLMNTNAARTKTIMEKVLRNYDMPVELAEMFRKFITACKQAVDEGQLDEEATTRLACNVVRACSKRAARDKRRYASVGAWLPAVKRQLRLEMAQVVGFERGPYDPDQEACYQALVEACFICN